MPNPKPSLILDTDIANECDDLFALAYLLKSQDMFNIEAITLAPYSHHNNPETLHDGQIKSYREAEKICHWLNFDTNKIFLGAETYFTDNPTQTPPAVAKIINTALANPETYLVAIGAPTNVALAIQQNPAIIPKLKIIWLGSNGLLQPLNDDFNFRQDLAAVRTLFNSKINLTVIPCKNVASNLRTSVYELNHFLKDKSNLCNYLIDRFYNDGYHGLQERRVIWDIATIAYLINPAWFTTQQISCPKINSDTSFRPTHFRHKITFVNHIDVDPLFTDLFTKLSQ